MRLVQLNPPRRPDVIRKLDQVTLVVAPAGHHARSVAPVQRVEAVDALRVGSVDALHLALGPRRRHNLKETEMVVGFLKREECETRTEFKRVRVKCEFTEVENKRE